MSERTGLRLAMSAILLGVFEGMWLGCVIGGFGALVAFAIFNPWWCFLAIAMLAVCAICRPDRLRRNGPPA